MGDRTGVVSSGTKIIERTPKSVFQPGLEFLRYEVEEIEVMHL